MKIAFCLYGVPLAAIRRVEFYRQDCEILKTIAGSVRQVFTPFELECGTDLAFVWWWNYLWLWSPAAAISGMPILTTGVFDIGAFNELPWYKQVLKRWGARRSNLNVVVNRDEEKRLPKLIGLKRGSVRYSPLVVDSSVYCPGDNRGMRGGAYRILNISWQRATNMRRKMVPELLEAFAEFSKEAPKTRLTLAGPPEDGGPILQARARELGVADKVEFPGEISRGEKVRRMQECDLYCQVSRYEGFGVAIAEALACGAPVLVSRVGAVPEVVGDCGSYVDEISSQGILEGLRKAYRDRSFARDRAELGVRRIRELFSVERRREDLRRYIAELV